MAFTQSRLVDLLPATSFLEHAFLRYALSPALTIGAARQAAAQYPVVCGPHTYKLDYALLGARLRIAIELDGYAFHASRDAFTYDRLRQNDLEAAGWRILRYSFAALARELPRCVQQLQALCAQDPLLATFLVAVPALETPTFAPDPALAYAPPPSRAAPGPSHATAPNAVAMAAHAGGSPSSPTSPSSDVGPSWRLNLATLRACQQEAYAALLRYFGDGGRRAACVMSVGAGKTALGVVGCLAFAHRRALIITPGSVIRGAFAHALDPQGVGNVLYGLPGGPLIPGQSPPRTLILDREEEPNRAVSRDRLLETQIIVTNFQSLGDGSASDDLLMKLAPDDIDLIVVDEAHIAAAASYQRAFARFPHARTLLMSACFQRLDGRPIDADVVYRYRLIDAIADGAARNLRIHRFTPIAAETTYETISTDGRRETIQGRDALVALLEDERRLAQITAQSDVSIRQVMAGVRAALDAQAAALAPVRPRALFSALGEGHAEQIARIAEEFGIPCASLHYQMGEARIRAVRARFEQESGDLQAIVQLKMLGQGYDFPAICVVAPLRPYKSFNEFYQFVGRGVRTLRPHHAAAAGALGAQLVDVVYHAEFQLDGLVEMIYRENDMDPPPMLGMGSAPVRPSADLRSPVTPTSNATGTLETPGVETGGGAMALGEGVPVADPTQTHPTTYVVFERGAIERRIIHDEARVEARRAEREREALAQRYAAYAAATPAPVSFETYVTIIQRLSE